MICKGDESIFWFGVGLAWDRGEGVSFCTCRGACSCSSARQTHQDCSSPSGIAWRAAFALGGET